MQFSDAYVLTSEGLMEYRCQSAQLAALAHLTSCGPSALVTPEVAYNLCVFAGLISPEAHVTSSSSFLVSQKYLLVKWCLRGNVGAVMLPYTYQTLCCIDEKEFLLQDLFLWHCSPLRDDLTNKVTCFCLYNFFTKMKDEAFLLIRPYVHWLLITLQVLHGCSFVLVIQYTVDLMNKMLFLSYQQL